MFDILILGGQIVDGARGPSYRADVGIRDDRIEQIGNLGEADAATKIDATGKVVAPGFVDVHNHSDAWMFKTPHLIPKTTQGFTSEVIMADGISYAPVNANTAHEWIYYLRGLNALRFEEYSGWETLGDYMSAVNGSSVQNFITHVPYANVRSLVCGFGRGAPDDFQMRTIQAEVEKGMDAGAVGLSTGLDYIVQCYATTDELVRACEPMVARQGLYVTHMRYKIGTLAALQEAVDIGRRAGVPVHISHLKGATTAQVEEILHFVDTVAVHETDFSFDVYPYMAGSTMLNYLLPYEVWDAGPMGVIAQLRRPEIRQQFAQGLEFMDLEATYIAWVAGKENSQHQGRTVADYCDEIGLSPAEALIELLIEENLSVLLVVHQGDETLINDVLSHSHYMIGSDGIYHEDGVIHPRQYGSATRILGPVVRDQKLFSLEDAVYKLSAYPAARFGLVNRGRIQEGWYADVVVFDAESVGDRATFAEPHQRSVGIEQVIVNGKRIIRDGHPADDLRPPYPGRSLKFNRD